MSDSRKTCTGPGRNGAALCGKPLSPGGWCRGHSAQMQREREQAREEGREPRPPEEVLRPLRERHDDEPRTVVKVVLDALALDAVDDAVERGDGPSRSAVIGQCVRQVLLPERAAAEGALSGSLAAAAAVFEQKPAK
jgi:hypothetical protein